MMQQDDLTTRPPSPSRHHLKTPYVAVWLVLSVMAVLYISVAVLSPDLLDTAKLEMPLPSSAKSNEGQRAQTIADTGKLQRRLSEMEKELARTKAENEHHTELEKVHLDRIAALEQNATQPTDPNTGPPVALDTQATDTQATGGVQTNNADKQTAGSTLAKTKILNHPASPATTTTIVKQVAKKPEIKDVTKTAAAKVTDVKKTTPAKVTTTTKTAIAKKTAPKVAVAPKPVAKVKTGSIDSAKTKPLDFGPAVVTRSTRPIGVRIATGPSVDSLRLSWSALADRHGPSLRKLQPRYVTGIDATGLTYDLIAGPIASADEANKVCQRLHENGVRCAIGEYTGNAL